MRGQENGILARSQSRGIQITRVLEVKSSVLCRKTVL